VAGKRSLLFSLLVLFSINGWGQVNNDPSLPASAADAIVKKDLEVAIGISEFEQLDFDFSPKFSVARPELLNITARPGKREIEFNGVKPGTTTVTIRDNAGDIRLQYTIVVTATGSSSVVSELRELIGDVEGIRIVIKGGKIVIEGEIVVPDDIGRVSKVLVNYPSVLTLIELSPQTQRVIARKMSDELAKNNLKDVTVRVVNKTYWLEGVVSNEEKKKLALIIAKAYLPPKLQTLAQTGEGRFAAPDQPDILDFIAVNEKKEPQPAPKMVKITAQFVELSKDYGRIFAFKWAPLMGQDSSQISIGQTESGNVTSTSSGTLSATISNLFPKLNAAKSAGYARVIQSAMVVTQNEKQAKIAKSTSIPFAVGTGETQRPQNAQIGINLSIEPRILEQENILMAVNLSVNLNAGTTSTGAPITTNNSVETNLIVKSKESAVIGGVVQSVSKTDYDKDDPAPITAQAGGQPVPPLFRLIRSKNYATSKSQYVMFLTPEIIESASAATEEIRKKFRRRQ
jgi:pilus assembly protein CpaC